MNPLIPPRQPRYEVTIYDPQGLVLDRVIVRDFDEALRLSKEGRIIARPLPPTIGEAIAEHLRQIVNLLWFWICVRCGKDDR